MGETLFNGHSGCLCSEHYVSNSVSTWKGHFPPEERGYSHNSAFTPTPRLRRPCRECHPSFRAEVCHPQQRDGLWACRGSRRWASAVIRDYSVCDSPLLKSWRLSNCRSQVLRLVIRPGLEKTHTISPPHLPPPPHLGEQGAEECSVYLSLSLCKFLSEWRWWGRRRGFACLRLAEPVSQGLVGWGTGKASLGQPKNRHWLILSYQLTSGALEGVRALSCRRSITKIHRFLRTESNKQIH